MLYCLFVYPPTCRRSMTQAVWIMWLQTKNMGDCFEWRCGGVTHAWLQWKSSDSTFICLPPQLICLSTWCSWEILVLRGFKEEGGGNPGMFLFLWTQTPFSGRLTLQFFCVNLLNRVEKRLFWKGVNPPPESDYGEEVGAGCGRQLVICSNKRWHRYAFPSS